MKLPKITKSSYANTSGSYGFDNGDVAFSDITELSGTRVERLKKAAENGAKRYKKMTQAQREYNKKHGPV